MNLDLLNNPPLQAAVIKRLTAEIGETFAANCALDLIASSLGAEVEHLRQQVADLTEKTTKDRQLIAELRAILSELRAPHSETEA